MAGEKRLPVMSSKEWVERGYDPEDYFAYAMTFSDPTGAAIKGSAFDEEIRKNKLISYADWIKKGGTPAEYDDYLNKNLPSRKKVKK